MADKNETDVTGAEPGAPMRVAPFPDTPKTIEASTDQQIADATRIALDGPPPPLDIASLAAPPGIEFIGEVARGGMGAVLLARDQELGREIAVKVLLSEHQQSAMATRRFVEEAQIGGQLQHPGVVPVYAFGRFSDQRPYFSMKLVKGRNLAELLRDRKHPSEDRPRYLKIFEQICLTMAYAHAKSVVHRDLKPSNVMVGDFGEVQVMDWGVAKVLSEHRSDDASPEALPEIVRGRPENVDDNATALPELGTQSGSVLGTPAYMPPEQAMGDIVNLDARADVFGLAAILCEILTGKPPYRGSDASQTLWFAIRGDLSDAFARLDDCGADLELVQLTKAGLSIDRARRPKDAGAFAELLTEYLDSVETRLKEAQLARVRAVARAESERRRRKSQLTLATALTLVLLAGIFGTTWFLRQAQSARKAAEDAQAGEHQQRKLAEDRRADAEQARELEVASRIKAENAARQEAAARAKAVAAQADTKAFSDFLVNHVLATARPEGVQGGLGIDVKMGDALAKAAGHVDEVFAGRPLAEATARHALGITWRNLGKHVEAERELARAVALRTEHLGAESEETMQSLVGQAINFRLWSSNEKALPILERVVAVRMKTIGPDHPETLQTLNNLALVYRRLGRNSEAIDLYERVHKAQVANHEIGPDNQDALRTANNLALAYQAAGNSMRAIDLFEEVREGLAKRLPEDHPEILTVLNNLGIAYLGVGKPSKATSLFELVVKGRVRKLSADHPMTLVAKHNLASAYERAGKTAEALALFEAVAVSREKKLGPADPLTLGTLRGLAASYLRSNLFDKAAAEFAKVVERMRALTPRDDAQLERDLIALADALQRAGKTAEAEGKRREIKSLNAALKKRG